MMKQPPLVSEDARGGMNRLKKQLKKPLTQTVSGFFIPFTIQ